ncbi:MAG: hypothetical protein LBV69_09120 [Bacteroidales bacterium]|nr:hypothetical protein [Bacteroidales bacterium]
MFKTKLFYKEFLPFIIVAFVYVLVYFGFNKFFASGDIYPGSTISDDFSLKNFFTIIFGYNSFIFPKHVLNVYGDWLYNIYATIPTLHQSGFLYILRNSEITTLVNAFLQCFLFVYFFNKLKSDISWKKIIITIVVSFLFAISAHSLHACASGYNSNIWMTQQIGYITSSFSYFALVTIFFFVVYAFNKLCYNKKILRYCVLTISTILLFANTIYIGYNNDKFFRYWHKNSHDQVAVIDKFCENDFLSDVSKDALLYMNDESGDSKFMHDLRLYLNYKMSRENTFAKFNLELLKEAISLDTTKDIYLLSSFVQRKSLNNDVLYTLSKVNNNSININVTDEDIFSSGTTNNVKVLFYSPYKDFNFNFYIENPNNDTNLPTYKVNDEIKTGNFGYNQIRILNNNNIGDGSTIFNLSSQYNIKVENFSISNMGSMNNDNSYVIQIEN